MIAEKYVKNICFNFSLLALSSFFVPCHSLFAQSLVQDTVLVRFESDAIRNAMVEVDTVIDQREESPRVVGRYEQMKYLFVPVDVLICTEQTLHQQIHKFFIQPKRNTDSLHLKLVCDEFRLHKKTNSLIYPHYVCYSSIHVYHVQQDHTEEYMGQLLHETTRRQQFFKDKLQQGFEAVMRKWQHEFMDDLDHISLKMAAGNKPTLDNFRFQPYVGKRLNMYGSVELIVGNQGWMTDGEIFFSQREAHRRFYRSSYNLRYRNTKNFESIEFGASIDNLFFRLSPEFIFRLKSQLMFGVNQWNDIDTKKHEIYDAFILDLAISQGLFYNPLDRSALIFGIGLMQNLYYVYTQNVKFQIGFLINLGIKL